MKRKCTDCIAEPVRSVHDLPMLDLFCQVAAEVASIELLRLSHSLCLPRLDPGSIFSSSPD